MSNQAELFPFASPETVLAYCRRLEAKVLKIAPEMGPEDCMRLLGELSLATMVADKIYERIRVSPEWVHRHSLPETHPVLSIVHAGEDVDQRLSWRWTKRRRRSMQSSSSK